MCTLAPLLTVCLSSINIFSTVCVGANIVTGFGNYYFRMIPYLTPIEQYILLIFLVVVSTSIGVDELMISFDNLKLGDIYKMITT